VTCEVNNSTCYNSLPYIQLSYPPVKLLIDTGCYKSIIRPGIAEKYFPFDIYHEPSKIKTSTGGKPIRFKAKTQAFPELNNDKIIEFLLFDFHEYFDGILGLKDLREMKLSINLVDKILTNGIMKIPFYYRQPVTRRNLSHSQCKFTRNFENETPGQLQQRRRDYIGTNHQRFIHS
jgi:hypothetical protein